MKKAGEGVDLSCFYGSDRLIMKYVDGAKMASFLITLDKGATLIPKTLMQLAVFAGVAFLVGCATPPDPAANAQAAAEKAQMQLRALHMYKVVGP